MEASTFVEIDRSDSDSFTINSDFFLESEKLTKRINDTLAEIKLFQNSIQFLENSLNLYLDYYYASGTFVAKTSEPDKETLDIDTSAINNLNLAKQNIYNHIAKICFFDILKLPEGDDHNSLVKIEGYLTDGNDSSKSPLEILAALAFELCDLSQRNQALHTNIGETSPIDAEVIFNQIKQEVLWLSIKSSDTISKIKNDITHQVNLST